MGRLISKLRIGKKIGNGHFGDVFLGEDDVHGTVAVKILSRAPNENDADWAKRRAGLLVEAKTY